MISIALWFRGDSLPELEKVSFMTSLRSAPRVSIRGKASRLNTDIGGFQWSSAVQALSILLLRAASLNKSAQPSTFQLLGERNSPAASLDFALGKQTKWLTDLFGFDPHGNLLARSLILRQNPELKRAGPVVLSLNPSLLTGDNIEVYFNEEPLEYSRQIAILADDIEASWALG